MELGLKGKTVVVTGGTRNLGRSISLAFLLEGANVVTTYLHDDDAARDFLGAVPVSQKPNVIVRKCDASSAVACRDLCTDSIRHFGSFHVLVNSAALNRSQKPEDMSDEDFESIMRNTLRSTLYMTRAAFEVMKQQRGGRIINLSTAGVYTANPQELLYICAKAGVEAATRAFARYGAQFKITVNAVAPHVIASGMGLDTAKHDQSIVSRIPLGRMGRIEELVSLVLYLSSDICEYLTGQVIGLNGGRLMQ
jgi:3-oxoacyl-[acyl-carrier protein] reductase